MVVCHRDGSASGGTVCFSSKGCEVVFFLFFLKDKYFIYLNGLKKSGRLKEGSGGKIIAACICAERL